MTGLHQILRKEAEFLGFSFAVEIPRSIKGMSNTMRDEYIVFLQKKLAISYGVNLRLGRVRRGAHSSVVLGYLRRR